MTKQKLYMLLPENNSHHWFIVFFSILAGLTIIAAIKTAEIIAATDSISSIIHTLFAMVVAFLVYALLVTGYRMRQLLFSANRLETLLKNLPGIVYRCTNQENWPMEFVSKGCYELCGYHSRELEEQRVLWGKFTHPDEIDRLKQTINYGVENEKPFEIEYRIVTATGEEKWVWERGRVVGSINENDVYLEGFITDITDRKKAETSALEAKAYAQAVVDTAVEGVITINSSGYVETLNRAAQEMFGYTLNEIKGKNVEILLSEIYHEEFKKFISHYLKTTELNISDSGKEVMGRRKDQSVFPMHLTVSEIAHHSGVKIVGVIRDLSMQRAAEKELREQREMLAHAARLNTLGEMATGIAHEINQPLTAISMYSQSCLRFLNTESPNIARLRDALEKLSTQAHRAGAVLERVQQLSKQHDSIREEVDCNELIRDVYKLAEVEAHMRHIAITLEQSKDLPNVLCDPIQTQQVILNLLRNGMESMATAKFRNSNQIVMSTEKQGNGVKISVTDSGNGITESVAEKLFQPFSSTKETGMGLGLSISRSIINAHGGDLEYINNKDSGATFYFTLPAAQ